MSDLEWVAKRDNEWCEKLNHVEVERDRLREALTFIGNDLAVPPWIRKIAKAALAKEARK